MQQKRSPLALRYLLPALIFIGLSVFLLLGLDRDPSTIPSPLIGKPAPAYRLARLAGMPPPAFGPLPSGSGNAGAAAGASAEATPGLLDASQLRGAPYLLNVWASWCTPCLQEHPLVLALARQRNIRIVGLNYKDEASNANRWLQRHGNPYDDVVVDPHGRTAIDFGVYGVPETFLIDADGQIRFKHVGPMTGEVLQQKLLPALQALAQGAP